MQESVLLPALLSVFVWSLSSIYSTTDNANGTDNTDNTNYAAHTAVACPAYSGAAEYANEHYRHC